MSTAHHVNALADLERRYSVSGYCYNRNRNPHRTALNEMCIRDRAQAIREKDAALKQKDIELESFVQRIAELEKKLMEK